ncbi:Tex-like N-terminal domain-containing protein, partial [Staphylococcus pseudintermedius]
MTNHFVQAIHNQYQYPVKHIEAVLKLLEEKNTVPFIARYRKEVTGGLDEVEIKQIADEYHYMEQLQKRKDEVIHSIEQQGLLTDELRRDIQQQTKLQRVEDLYRPYKQKKKTRATEAKRKGIEPLAEWIYRQKLDADLGEKAQTFLTDEVTSVEEAIQGAQDIIAEKIADHPQYRKQILKLTQKEGLMTALKKKKAEDEKAVFEMYYDYQEPLRQVANHRILAMNRGENEKILQVKIEMDKAILAQNIK